MKKFLMFWLFVFVLLFSFSFAYEDCNEILEQCTKYADLLKNPLWYTQEQYYALLASGEAVCAEAEDCARILQQQYNDVKSLSSEWYNLINRWKYDEAILKYKDAMKIVWDKTDENYKIFEENIIYCYKMMWDIASKKEQWSNAITHYSNALKIDIKDSYSYYAIGAIYFQQKDYDNALKYFQRSYEFATDKKMIEGLAEYIDYIKFMQGESVKQKDSVSSDFFSYRTLPFLQLNNIVEAWQNVDELESNEVIVAVIDDGIYMNHPDLTDNIWINSDEIPNNGIDDDKNWFKDDYNGWNFVYNNNNLLPLGTHWTMVAWIIGAVRDNDEWIAWVTKKVKLMPIWVCDVDWCDDKDIIAWINYAIDNWANIINLSLWGSQFVFTNSYNDVIKRAYNHWVVVVIAAWNGDILTASKNGVNTSVNPLSPVCNHWDNEKSIIWVWALNLSWQKAEWSNYWDCVNFWALWEGVFSTIIPAVSDRTWELYNQLYNFWIWTCDYWAGTSFSSPIMAWIVWLWYNKYWYVSPDIVWDSLKKSMWTWYLVDANKYLEILWSLDSLDSKIKLSWKEKFQEWWYNTKKKIHVFFDWFKESESIVTSIDSYQEFIEFKD